MKPRPQFPFLSVRSAVSLAVLVAGAAQAEVAATYELRPTGTDGSVINFDFLLNFSADSGERLVYFGIDVSKSAESLTRGGTDFSAFSFAAAQPLLTGWNQIPNAYFGPGHFRFTAEYETAFTALTPNVYRLGQLSVDFAQIGLTTPDAALVDVSGRDSVIGFELPNTPGSFRFQDVVVVPEPTTLGLLACGGVVALASLRRQIRDRIR